MNISQIDQLYDWSQQPNLSPGFWRSVDSISPQQIIGLADLLLSTRLLVGSEYVQLVGIIGQYRSVGTWTDRQRRSAVMFILAYWRDIDWRLQ